MNNGFSSLSSNDQSKHERYGRKKFNPIFSHKTEKINVQDFFIYKTLPPLHTDDPSGDEGYPNQDQDRSSTGYASIPVTGTIPDDIDVPEPDFVKPEPRISNLPRKPSIVPQSRRRPRHYSDNRSSSTQTLEKDVIGSTPELLILFI